MKAYKMKAARYAVGALLVAGFAGHTASVYAQAAGAGADFNRAERAAIQERQRLERIDPPIRPDPVGNVLIGGAVQEIQRNAEDNRRTGRGGPGDPRFNPGTLLNR